MSRDTISGQGIDKTKQSNQCPGNLDYCFSSSTRITNHLTENMIEFIILDKGKKKKKKKEPIMQHSSLAIG